MCFGGKTKSPPPPPRPPEVLEQEAPAKKTAKGHTLSIGTKKYQSDYQASNGLGATDSANTPDKSKASVYK